MKKITIVVPTYNEEGNIQLVYDEVKKLFATELNRYDYSIMFIDNDSKDNTRALIRALAQNDSHVQAIFNARNFGQMRSHFYALTQAEGDCAVLLHADMQNPLSAVVEFVKRWENGAKVVIGIKDNSKENPIMFFLRSCYYKVMKHISEVEQIQHFSDFELLDRDFLNVLKELKDPTPYLRGIVSELGFKMERVHYSQNKREHGKSSANFFVLYDFAMNGITSYSKSLLRAATMTGSLLSLVSFIVAISTLVRKLLYWDSFQPGVAAIGVGIFFLGSIQILFIGLLGEYILNMNVRILNRPLVIEEERIGFEKK